MLYHVRLQVNNKSNFDLLCQRDRDMRHCDVLSHTEICHVLFVHVPAICLPFILTKLIYVAMCVVSLCVVSRLLSFSRELCS